MLDSREYANRVNALQRRLHSLVRSVLKRAQVDDVHDMRTALRRLQTIAGLLPRGGGRSAYLESLKVLSRASRELRDLDVIALRLDSHPGNAPGGVRKELSIQREKAAEELQEKLKEYDENWFLFKPGKQKILQAVETHARAVKKAERRLDELLPGISVEPVEMEELHEFRKTGRKLRYLLELTGEKARIRKLTEIQDRLGELRDIDLTLGYISQSGESDALGKVVSREKARRTLLLSDVAKVAAEASHPDREKD